MLSTALLHQADVRTERCSDLLKTLLQVVHRNVFEVAGESPPLITVFESSSTSPILAAWINTHRDPLYTGLSVVEDVVM